MKFALKINRWINTILQDTHNHFSCFLPEKTSFVSSFILNRLFTGIKINQDLRHIIERLPKDAIIVYTAKYKSYFEFLCYYACYRKNNLPYPRIGFDFKIWIWQPVSVLFRIFLSHLDYFLRYYKLPDPYISGHIRDEMINGRSAFLPLIEKKDFYQRFVREKTDPIRHLIEIQKTTNRPICIIPQLLFFGKKPQPETQTIADILFGSEQKPGRLRQFATLFRNPGKIFIEISDPLNLKTCIKQDKNKALDSNHLALLIRRDLLNLINRHRKSITGPAPKSSDELKQNILTNARIREFMVKYAKRRQITIQQVHKEAHKYLDEIASKYHPGFVNILYYVSKWFVGIIFEGVVFNRDGLHEVKSASRNGPVILVPCHRSHIDSMIIPYILYKNNMPCPHFFAGKNLSFWPLGPLLRRVGVFFVRRTFAGAVFYSKIFSEYIYTLLNEEFNIGVFIEGTRSRSGKLLTPQLGMLSILLNAFKNGACDHMTFVPVSIGYDRIPEENIYIDEINGEKKGAENFGQMIRAGRILKKRYGKIYINFDTPFSLNELLNNYGKSIHEMTSKEQNEFCRDIGNRILNAIDRGSIVTPRALVASAILNCSAPVFSRKELDFTIDTLMTCLLSQKTRISQTLVYDQAYATEQILSFYIQRKLISPFPYKKSTKESDIKYRTNMNKRHALEYYKNNCIYFFIPAAFTALAILEKDAFQFSASDLHNSYILLQNMFINEFTRDMEHPPAFIVRKTLKSFIDDGILVPHPTLPDSYNLTSTGFKKIKLFAGFAQPFLEAYLIVLNYFKKYPKNTHNHNKRLKKIQSGGEQTYKRGEIKRKESLSIINYTNAVNFFVKNGVRGSEDQQKISFYSDAIKKHLR